MGKEHDTRIVKAAAAEIKSRRARIDINQEELAHRADVHRSYIARLEVGQSQPTLAVFIRIARALEADPAEVLGAIVKRSKRES
ncbi:MAG TPA: helix-turn-helix domain-containing protein [Roseateles sp.]|uniref:helix-turn-helix domain-containing protein n=1 Tax=Roseateles sp. TaxID=1971397 RepID=UPI002EDB0A90